jgi:hypothetical protein
MMGGWVGGGGEFKKGPTHGGGDRLGGRPPPSLSPRCRRCDTAAICHTNAASAAVSGEGERTVR